MKTSTLLIRTPEGIVFSPLLAGPVTRFLAWFIDLLRSGAMLTLLSQGLILLQLISVNLAQAFYALGFFVMKEKDLNSSCVKRTMNWKEPILQRIVFLQVCRMNYAPRSTPF